MVGDVGTFGRIACVLVQGFPFWVWFLVLRVFLVLVWLPGVPGYALASETVVEALNRVLPKFI
eukprot:3370097-Rhodomonas_salina.1